MGAQVTWEVCPKSLIFDSIFKILKVSEYIYISDSQLVRKHLSREEYPKKEEIPAKPTRRRGQKDVAPGRQGERGGQGVRGKDRGTGKKP